MDTLRINKIYSLYEILNDFNRLSVLISLHKNEREIDEIMEITGLSFTIVNHQLYYLIKKEVVSKNNNKYKISNSTLKKIVTRMVEYVDIK